MGLDQPGHGTAAAAAAQPAGELAGIRVVSEGGCTTHTNQLAAATAAAAAQQGQQQPGGSSSAQDLCGGEPPAAEEEAWASALARAQQGDEAAVLHCSHQMLAQGDHHAARQLLHLVSAAPGGACAVVTPHAWP